MNRNKNQFNIVYDHDADVLYVMRGQPEYTDCVEYADDLILRFHSGTKQLVGFALVDFSRHFAKKDSDIALPFGVDFHMHGELPY